MCLRDRLACRSHTQSAAGSTECTCVTRERDDGLTPPPGASNDIIATQNNSCAFHISSGGALSRLGDCSSLENLDLSNKGIKSLAPGLFDDMSKVSRIFLDGNQLETLPGHLFHSNTALFQISLSNNHLRTLPADLFEKNVDLW